jgi:ABC-type phosphate transport system substrate-binding protein
MKNAYFLTSLISVLFSANLWAGSVVIVHPSNANTLSLDDVAKIYLGKRKSYPDGNEAIPLDHPEGSASRTVFVTNVLKKNDQQIKAYWAQLLFTGKGTPPKEVSSSEEVKRLVASNPALIGYIDEAVVDNSVTVVSSF